jgi:hypothetical protein
MTQAPDLTTQDLVKIYFNGLILENGNTSQSIEGIVAPPRLEHSLSEQLWVHEKMIDSLVDAAADTIFPLEVTDESVINQLKQVFFEIPAYYGKDVVMSLKVNMQTDGVQQIKFDSNRGIILGDRDNVITTIGIVCSNATTSNQTAVELTMNLEASLNASIFNFVLFPHVDQISISNAAMTVNNVGMYSHNYNLLFTNILKNFANDLNMKYTNGFPFA